MYDLSSDNMLSLSKNQALVKSFFTTIHSTDNSILSHFQLKPKLLI